jgi:gamma-glutamylaminecyclotransferase
VKLFVYGSLKTGYWNNGKLRTCHLAGVAYSYEKYHLVADAFPFAIPETSHMFDCPALPIKGEVWDVDRPTLADIDAMEGEGHWYFRETRKFFMEKGGIVDAFIYEFPHMSQCQPCAVEDGMYIWR